MNIENTEAQPDAPDAVSINPFPDYAGTKVVPLPSPSEERWTVDTMKLKMSQQEREVRRERVMGEYYNGLLQEDPRGALEKAGQLLDTMEGMNQRYAVATIEGETIVIDTQSIASAAEDTRNAVVKEATVLKQYPTAMAFADFEKKFMNRKVTIQPGANPVKSTISKVWLEWSGRREYGEGIIFAPGHTQAEVGHDRLNLFTGWGTPPEDWIATDDEERCSKMLHYLRHVVCGGASTEEECETLYEWVLCWLADVVQDPMNKKATALVLQGKKGCGKSTLPELMRDIVGERYWKEVSKKEEIVGTFNGTLATSLLVSCDEVAFGGNAVDNEILKNLISQKTISINEKYVPRYESRSCCRLIFTTNSHYSHNTSIDERRYLFLDIGDTYVGDDEPGGYWDQLKSQWRNGGVQAFANILHRKVIPTTVNLRRAPKTQAHTRLLAESLDVEERYFFNALTTGENYPEDAVEEGAEVLLSEVRQKFEFYLDDNGLQKSRKRSENVYIPTMMAKWWGAEKLSRRVIKGKKVQPYMLPSLHDAKMAALTPAVDGGLGLTREDLDMEEDRETEG